MRLLKPIVNIFLFALVFFNASLVFADTALPPFETERLDHLILALPVPASAPGVKNQRLLPYVNSKAAIAVDIDSGVVLYEKNIHQRLPIASITKLMTSLVVLDGVADLGLPVTVPKDVTSIEPAKMYLLPGDVLSVKQLLLGALVHSANDAAHTLSFLFPDFIDRMNAKAAELHLNNTHFSNEVGWDEEGNFSSAYDLTKLLRYALSKKIIADALVIPQMDITSSKGRTYHLESTNKLLNSFLDEIGGKTGTTDEAGACFINVFETPDGHRIMTVVLNSPDRFAETKLLSYWVTKNFEWK